MTTTAPAPTALHRFTVECQTSARAPRFTVDVFAHSKRDAAAMAVEHYRREHNEPGAQVFTFVTDIGHDIAEAFVRLDEALFYLSRALRIGGDLPGPYQQHLADALVHVNIADDHAVEVNAEVRR